MENSSPRSPADNTAREIQGRSLSEVARNIFGDDPESIQRWIGYWEQSRERNRQLLETFGGLTFLDFRRKRVLDIGCGTGGLGELIGDGCRLYAGADYHPHVLRFAEPADHRGYLRCSGTQLPFPDETFDCVFNFDVIEHLVGGESWQRQFMQELRRVLKPLGMMFFTTPNFWYPYEGHSQLYFPQYLPAFLRDRYIGWRKPGFLREHHTFAEIPLVTPRRLRGLLRDSGLEFLHDLPCAMDKGELLSQHPVRGWLSFVGMGWYPHAEFWGILARKESATALRLKLRKNWYYERNQPSAAGPSDFGSRIDFRAGSYGPQLGPGWHWYEEGGYRWTEKSAICYLQSGDLPVTRLRVIGFASTDNHVEVRLRTYPGRPVRIGETILERQKTFELEYLVPFGDTRNKIFEACIRCKESFRPEDPTDQRELGLMVSSVEIA